MKNGASERECERTKMCECARSTGVQLGYHVVQRTPASFRIQLYVYYCMTNADSV